MKFIGELIEVISGDRVKELKEAADPDLFDVGRWVIGGLKKTTGEGSPDTGALFGHGHSGFENVDQALLSAAPGDGWEGSGSRAYADQNTRQRLRAETMADADREVHRVLTREAAQLTFGRAILDAESDFLAHAGCAAFPLQFVPRYGGAARLAIEASALQAALGESAQQLHQLHSEVAVNAAELQQAIGRYSVVGDGAEAPVHSAGLQAPVPVRLDPDTSPGKSPQDEKWENDRMSGEDLRVATARLGVLAAQQARAAAESRSATLAVDGVDAAVRSTHGSIAAGTSRALDALLDARRNAGTRMAAISDSLSDKLTDAAKRYERSDDAARRSLDEQTGQL